MLDLILWITHTRGRVRCTGKAELQGLLSKSWSVILCENLHVGLNYGKYVSRRRNQKTGARVIYCLFYLLSLLQRWQSFLIFPLPPAPLIRKTFLFYLNLIFFVSLQCRQYDYYSFVLMAYQGAKLTYKVDVSIYCVSLIRKRSLAHWAGKAICICRHLSLPRINLYLSIVPFRIKHNRPADLPTPGIPNVPSDAVTWRALRHRWQNFLVKYWADSVVWVWRGRQKGCRCSSPFFSSGPDFLKRAERCAKSISWPWVSVYRPTSK